MLKLAYNVGRPAMATLVRITRGPWFDSRLRNDRFFYVNFICLFNFLHRASLCFSYNSPMQSINKSINNSIQVASPRNSYDVRLINVKIGVQRRKSRNGIMVSTLVRITRGPWFDSRLRINRFFYVNVICLFNFLHRASLCFSYNHTGPSFNTGTENTIQVSKFKRIGFENNGGFRWRRIRKCIFNYYSTLIVKVFSYANTLTDHTKYVLFYSEYL